MAVRVQIADITEVFEAVEVACRGNQKISLLIGAGCSVTAGIPEASGIVKRISERYPERYRASAAQAQIPPSYQQCMARLSPLERRGLMAEYVNGARINWAHISIACLIRAGIVDRVLTVNFDPLIIRACALLNEFPGIYDFAASQIFDASHVSDKAVFYLHGQQSGFVQLHTKEQVELHSKRLAPVFEDAGRQRLWIVVGYSGVNDPVIENLSKLDSFANGLYWIGRPSSPPPESVAESLLAPQKSGFFVECEGADEFFLQLARRTKCFPPPIFATPFTHLQSVYSTLDHKFPTLAIDHLDDGNANPLQEPTNWIEDAIVQYEKKREEVSFVLDRYLAGDFDAIVARYERAPKSIPADARDKVGFSFLKVGGFLFNSASGEKVREKRRDLLLRAEGQFLAATTIDPTMIDALTGWAAALRMRANIEDDKTADHLLSQALDKYVAILVVKPDSHSALRSMGEVLSEIANYKTPKVAAKYYVQAQQKFEDAIVIKPNDHETYYEWGWCLIGQATFGQAPSIPKPGPAELLILAREKFEAALLAKPGDARTLVALGTALSDLAANKIGREANRLYAEAHRHFAAALKIKPDSAYTLRIWSNMLQGQADNTFDDDKRWLLLEEAIDKAKAAHAIAPDDSRALYSWGHALFQKSQRRIGKEQIQLLRAAQEKFEQSISIDPNNHLPHFYCGHTLLLQASLVYDIAIDERVSQAERCLAEAVRLCPRDFHAVHSWGQALHELAKARSTRKANKRKLLAQAMDKYSEVAAWKPDHHEALHDWGRALSDLASLAVGVEADRLTRLAHEKYAAAKIVRTGKSA